MRNVYLSISPQNGGLLESANLFILSEKCSNVRLVIERFPHSE